MRELKKSPAHKNKYIIDNIEADNRSKLEIYFVISTEWDEFWSYAGSKKQQRWTWYVIDRRSGCILAWRNGRCKEEVLPQLIDEVADLPIVVCHTDDWAAYTTNACLRIGGMRWEKPIHGKLSARI